jgi:hypothetical protein
LAASAFTIFSSKQAIGEAVCRSAHSRIHAASRLRKVFRCIVDKGFALFFRERKLHEVTS